MKTTHTKDIVIVAGAAGEIGTEYCRTLAERQIPVLAVIRNNRPLIDSQFVTLVKCDLSNPYMIKESFGSIDFGQYDRIIFLHTIGTDKYDPRGYPHIQKMKTIDADVYDTNVNTFKYPLRYLLDTIRTIKKVTGKTVQLKVGLLGGIPDKFAPFVIEGFCEAKNICRQYMLSATKLYPEWVSAVAINVSSTITKSALKVRPLADLMYWLTPAEVVKRSVDTLVAPASGYGEIEIYKHSPEFQNGYYEDAEALYKKWHYETGSTRT